MMRPFIMDLITFIRKFLALLQFWPAQKTYPEVNTPQSAF